MLYQEVPVTVPGQSAPAVLRAYVQDIITEIEPDRKRPAIIICPGGGYTFLSNREAEPVALRFLQEGFNTFILYYHPAPDHYPVAQLELARAIMQLRENADAWHIDPNAIFTMGFSAGGHLAASGGILYNREDVLKPLHTTAEKIRPTGMVLCYPVITSGPYAHRGSFDNLLGGQASDPDMLERVSLEKQVDDETVPAFVWHTATDGAVPVQNSLLLTNALAAHHVPFELHIFPNGCHGLSLSNKETYGPQTYAYMVPECAQWPSLAARWMNQIGGKA